MNKKIDTKPDIVPLAKRDGEIYSRWEWVEREAWTERMLNALETGVKGGKWYSLFDKVRAPKVLRAAFKSVKVNKGGAGIDHQTVEGFGNNLEENIKRISLQLKEGIYQPQAVKRVWIPKPGKSKKRPLGIPTVRDRVVQTALRMVLEPIFELEFASCSHGFRPKRGCKDALREIDEALKDGLNWVVDGDILDFFGNLNHDLLMERVSQRVVDKRVLEYIKKYLNQEIMDGAKIWTAESGSPQGAVISPLLSNIYLNPLDHIMMKEGFRFIRYADDWVVMCESKETAQTALDLISLWMKDNHLELHPEKTRIAEYPYERFVFLGYIFGKYYGKPYKRPCKKSLNKFKDSIRAITRRTNGKSMEEIIKKINMISRGWFEYYKHSRPNVFKILDGWIRMRLRSIIRSRHKRKGRSTGKEKSLYSNAYFTELGFFSLIEARVSVVQSLRG
jgi:RNA-directed DNA polymerase